MTEFVSKDGPVQEASDSLLDQRMSQDLVNGRSLLRVLDQHTFNQLVELGSEVSRKALVLALDNFLSQLVETRCVEGRLEGRHLV